MKQEPKNDLVFNCWTKSKQLLKKELSNVTPASLRSQEYSKIRQRIGGSLQLVTML